MRLFLAATDELADSRELVARLAERWSSEHSPDNPLVVHDWSAYVAEQMATERLPLLPLEPGDIFLGLVWLRFGTSAAGSEGGIADFGAATAEDFELAYRSWASAPATASLFYRCKKLPASLDAIQGEELARIERFFARFSDGKSPGNFGEYTGAKALEENVLADLLRVTGELRAGASRIAGTGKKEAEPAAESLPAYAQKMEPGKAYEVSFLALEIDGFEDLLKRHVARREDVETLGRSFRQLVVETAAGYGGEVFTWDSETGRGLLMFWSKRSHDHAIITGLKVLHGLPVFHLDPLQNPLGLDLEIRTAAHDAVIVFKKPIQSIDSGDLDFLRQVVRKIAHGGELCVSKRLLDRADERLRNRFKGKERLDGEPIHACRLPSTEQHALRSSLERAMKRLTAEARTIQEGLGRPTAEIEPANVEAIGRSVDETYALLDRTGGLLGRIDKGWSRKVFADLAALVRSLMKEEEILWKTLRRGHQEHQASPEIGERLGAIVQTAASQRSRPTVTLGRAVERLMARASEEGGVSSDRSGLDEALKKKIDAFLRADPLDHDKLLTDLLLNEKSRLLDVLSRPRRDEAYQSLKDKLWESADLLLVDDLYSIRGHQRANERKIYDVLVDKPVADGRFQVVRQLLREEFRPAESLVRQRFQQVGLEAENRDLQIVWRSVVLGHAVIKIRHLTALKMSQFSMWQAIAHPNVPIPSLHAIGERISKSEADDAKKIFFDCIRSRVLVAVEGFRTRDELSAITKLILLLLDFPFLVEGGYFERFDDILEKFLERSQHLGLEVEYFENLRHRLESAKTDSGSSEGSRMPTGITKLPLSIQRRLAAEKNYLHWFVTHPDARIAGETVRHISLSNVEQVLRSPEINGKVMAQLLKKPELFTRSGPLLAALNNPKCDVAFANRYLGNLGRSRGGLAALGKLAKNPSANPAIRQAARRLTTEQARQSKR